LGRATLTAEPVWRFVWGHRALTTRRALEEATKSALYHAAKDIMARLYHYTPAQSVALQ
jgi:hypothetical protein